MSATAGFFIGVFFTLVLFLLIVLCIIFSKRKDGSLHFVNMVFNDKNRLINFIEGLNMEISEKHLVTKEGK